MADFPTLCSLWHKSDWWLSHPKNPWRCHSRKQAVRVRDAKGAKPLSTIVEVRTQAVRVSTDSWMRGQNIRPFQDISSPELKKMSCWLFHDSSWFNRLPLAIPWGRLDNRCAPHQPVRTQSWRRRPWKNGAHGAVFGVQATQLCRCGMFRYLLS